MTVHSALRYLLLLGAFAALSGCDNECTLGSVPSSELSKEQQDEMKLFAPWLSHVKVCRIGGYVVMGPADGGSEDLIVTRSGTSVLFESAAQIHVQSKGGSLVSIQDLGGTGLFDSVSYSIVDPEDGQKYTVTDANADGHLDTKVGEHGFFVNIDGKWCKAEKLGDQPGAIVDGMWKALKKKGRVWGLASD
jgi:hypothetical protein